MQAKFVKLTVLGSGTCVPREDRGSPGFFLEIGKTKILLDCGPGALRQLVKAGKDYKDIDLVIISHLHVDHTSDLPALLHAINYTPDFDRKKELFILGGIGFEEFFEDLTRTFPHIKPRPDTYEIKLAKEKEVNEKFKDFTLETIQGNHAPSSMIIKINAFGKSLVYTGDTDYDKKISQFSKGIDLLITECSYPDQRKVKGHLTPKWAAKMASVAQAKTLLLTHFYPPIDKVNIKAAVEKYFSGRTAVTRDFMELKI